MNLDQQLTELAQYHVGIFLGAVSSIDLRTPAAKAHALFILGQVAAARRDEWITQPGLSPQEAHSRGSR